MILPESERSAAVAKALAIVEDPRTEILATSEHGAAVRDHAGNVLSITRRMIAFTPAERSSK